MRTIKYTKPIKNILFFMVALLTLNSNIFSQKNETLPYKNTKLSPRERAKDLLSRLSIEEKTCQLMAVWDGIPFPFDSTFLKDTVKMRSVFGNGVNSVQPSFTDLKTTVETRNTIQKYLLEKTRWGIPAIFVDEGQHGLMRPDATSFPQAIGLACSWDPELFQKVYGTIAHEMRSRGTHHVLSPVIDVCRDPRWGRVEETYGEDPYLNGILGIAAVRGFQGTSTGQIGPENVAATLKHFAGHGQSEGGINQGPANYSLRVLREFHMPPFKMNIDSAHPAAIMPSYNEVDGVPSHVNKWLLKDVLRKEWGYNGMIVSDYSGIDQLFEKHFVAASKEESAEKAFNAGVQYEFPMANYYHSLPALVKSGKINRAEIDSAVLKVLELKFALGLFDNPFVDLKKAEEVSKNEASAALALQAAQESIVLLKNEGNLLPLSTEKYKKIAVVGPCAKDLYFGGYSGEPYQKVSLFDGIKAKVNGKAEVIFAQGCKLTTNNSISFYNWKRDQVEFASREENLKLIREAAETARNADVIVLAIGENELLCREAWAKNHIGDNMTLDLFGQQEELVKAIVATGKPVVVYLMNGRPLSINYIVKNVPAIIEGWYMGQATGTAAASIIFGDVNPSGKLTITFPKSAGQLPMYYNHKPSAQYLDYISSDVKPLFPFGYGLSYTTFAYSKPHLSDTTIKPNGMAKVSVAITNSGSMKGDEIVQLYIRDKVSSVTRPVKELKDFKRISLEPGQTKNIEFTIDKSKLSFWDINMKYTVEPGEFDIMLGNSSENLQTVILKVE